MIYRNLSPKKQNIFLNQDFIFLFINGALVIIGYGLSVATGGATIAFMKTVKSLVLFLSIFVLFKDINFTRRAFHSPSIIYILVFTFWTILMSFFAKDVMYSLRRSLEFLIPFLYVYIALHNLIQKYELFALLRAFIKAFNIIYIIPVISFLITGRGLGNMNIYGEGGQEGQFFISNHYGWASCIFILTSIDILLNNKTRYLYRGFLITFSIIAMYLLLISGNRSSWLSLILALMIFVLKLKIIRTDFKILILIIPVLIIIWIAAIPESSLNMRLNDTEKQMEQGEARFDVAETATGYFNESKWKWFTGAGMFNYAEVIPGNQLSDYHNSYFEILFGGGVILFILFLNFMLFRPLYFYTLYYSKYFISIPPFIVIPYFEANITGGQFLFYPWFIFLLLYNIKPVSKQEEITLKERFYGKRMQERKHVYS